jgi:hypothetical protein
MKLLDNLQRRFALPHVTEGLIACQVLTYVFCLTNPHQTDDAPGDVDHLLPEYEKLLTRIAETRGQLKAQLMEALSR